MLGEAQRNRVSARQLATIGFSDRMIDTACRRGQLQRRHQGVYILGSDVPVELGAETAALLTAPGLMLVSLSVLSAVGAIPADPRRAIHVCGPSKSRPGITVHRYRDPPRARIVKGLPMTTVERALLDAADELSRRQLERAVDEALAARLTSRTKLGETAERATGRRGQAELRALADARRPGSLTKREAAELALGLMRAAGLPEPQTEVRLFGFDADFFFADAGLVLEVDSFAYHGLIRANFNRDRRKDRVYRQHGLEVVRVTADELKDTPLLFVADLSAAIAKRMSLREAA